MGIPTLELHPGAGLGPFVLGSPICDALAEVEQHQSLFESTAIKYNEQDPLSWDIVVAFPHLGFHLCFHPNNQRLYKIEIYDITRLHLRYAGNIVGGPSTPATFSCMYSVLGPTFPGVYSQSTGLYILSYPGLSLLFKIPPRYANCCLECKELPLEFPDGTTPVVSRVVLHLGQLATQSQEKGNPTAGLGVEGIPDEAHNTEADAALTRQMLSMPSLPLPHGGMYMEEVQVRLGESIFFTAAQQEVCFGYSPQDVWSELGRPCNITQREGGSMLIHFPASCVDNSAQHQNQRQHQRAGQQQAGQLSGLSPLTNPGNQEDFVWSYFRRGIDVIFDADTRSVKKFVLHTNAPGHPDFNEYAKCNFVILPRGGVPASLDQAKAVAKGTVTADSKWEDVQRVLGGAGLAPIQTAAGSFRVSFGPTFVYGLEGATFEIMRNGQISTVTLFEVGAF